MSKTITLNSDQLAAIEKIKSWLASPAEPFFLLEGYAGTGKTTAIRSLISAIKGRLVFTAPTNKATKVLREVLTSPEYKPDCRTIYSLLGLRLEANGEVKELSVPEDPIDLSLFVAVVVDEGSMVNRVLMQHIRQCAEEQRLKFIFMGDSAQLPPVKETSSPVWAFRDKPECYARLDKVMRHDNQILTLVTAMRRVVDHPAPSIRIASDNDGEQGVWKMTGQDFYAAIRKDAAAGMFSEPDNTKAIAWRNVTVDRLNAIVRAQIFDDVSQPWLPTDRVIFTSPARDLDDEPIASTDDEGTVIRISEGWHPTYPDFKTHTVTITLDDNRTAEARVLHSESAKAYEAKVAELADAARKDGRKWRLFWDFKEAFHGLRHAYAITAHRSQGSTYDRVYVDYRDVLLNQNRQEAFRCLYVACTRPRRELILA